MTQTPQYETDRLTELVCRREECLRQLVEMGRKQLAIVEQGDMTALFDVLSAKQRVVSDIERVERALGPFRNQDPLCRVWRSTQARNQCQARLDECERLLAEVLTQETQSQQELVRRRDETKQQLQRFNQAAKARGAYEFFSHGEAGCLDLTSEMDRRS